MQYAYLREIDLTHANLENADLSYSVLDINSICINTSFKNCNFSKIEGLKFLPGFISRMIAKDRKEIKKLLPRHSPQDLYEKYDTVNFIYCDHDTTIEPYFNLKLTENINFGEILILLFTSSKKIKWKVKINSIFLVDYIIIEKALCILTIEDEAIKINIETGAISYLADKTLFHNWKNANLQGVIGLDAKTAYSLRLFGAINVPKIADEYDPYQDSEITRSLI